MSRRSEYDAAYFTLLRAHEELGHLRRYQGYLEEELARLATFVTAVNTGPDEIPRKFRKLVDGSAKQLIEAVGRRRSVVLSEQKSLPDRIAAQEAFVRELEEEVAALRSAQ